MTPEEKARQQIDAQLAACGWVVQDFKAVDFSAGRGIALRAVPLTTAPYDYLLVVDRNEFRRYHTPDTNRLFTELYNVQHLTSPHIDDVCRVTICTIKRLYSILRGEELAEGADDLAGAEIAAALGKSGSGVPPLGSEDTKRQDAASTLNHVAPAKALRGGMVLKPKKTNNREGAREQGNSRRHSTHSAGSGQASSASPITGVNREWAIQW